MADQGPSRPGFTVVGVDARYSGIVVDVEVRAVTTPDGETVEREVVLHPGSVGVLPIEDGHAVLLRQHRVPAGSDLLEIPAGLLDVEGESPEEAAARECVEEVGRRPGHMQALGDFYNSPGWSNEFTRLFLAGDLVEVAALPGAAEERAAEVVRLPWPDLVGMARNGLLRDAKTILAVLIADARDLVDS